MHITKVELEAGLTRIMDSPKEGGVVELIVCRPETGQRKVLPSAELDCQVGLVGDNWLVRGNKKSLDGKAIPDTQLNIMNARAIDLIAQSKDRWPLAGDQFFVGMDLSAENLPPGTHLQIGDAVIQVTAEPHLGCKKFMERYGKDAAVFVNSSVGKALNLRGINARVIKPGRVVQGAIMQKVV